MRTLFTLTFIVIATCLRAQDYVITGKVVENATGDAVEMATVRVMKADSSFVTGASTGEDGTFKVNTKKAGNYILKFSFIGYNSVFKNVTLSANSPSATVGTIKLTTNDRIMKEASIKANVAKVEMRKDTFIYNVAAYRVPEGATLEALIDKLPGAVVDDDGGITINGKTVSEIRVDGKDFFKGDTKVAMKNVPVTLINRVKAYDMQSDYTKETGIDDGNEKTVLDLELKQKLKRTWFTNLDLAYGNRDRYSDNVFMNTFSDVSRISAFANFNNTGDQRFRGGGPNFRGGQNGLNSSKYFGLDGFWNNGKKEQEGGYFQINGNMRYSHRNSDTKSRSNSENFLNTSGTSSSFGNSDSHSLGSNSNINAELNLRWKPDTLTTIYVRSNFSYSENDNSSSSRNATFNNNPYEITSNPLDSIFSNSAVINLPTLAQIAVNTNARQSLSDGNGNNFGANGGITRRLNKKGRSISLDAGISSSSNKSHSYSISNIQYFQHGGSQTFNNQYSTSPSKSWNYNTRLSYSEPLAKNLYFQGSYNYRYSYSDRDRSLFYLDSLSTLYPNSLWGNPLYHYPIGMLPEGDSLRMVLNMENSQYATYKDYIHNINLGIRYVTEDINFSAGIGIEPQRTRLDYQKHNLDTIVTRDVFNISPNVRLRYSFSRYSRLELRYRGSSSQPSMVDLLDVVDNSDPLNISMGNPNLKPSWSNRFDVNYNNYWVEYQRTFNVWASLSQTSNSISNAVRYNEETGVRTSRPENINSNWNFWAGTFMNTAFGSQKQFNFSTNTDGSYGQDVSFIRTNTTESEKNKMRTINLSERIRTSWRSDFFEFGVTGSINYTHARSTQESRSDLDTYTFTYGATAQLNSTWNMSLSTDIAMNSRRGYNDASMNTNELIWNLQLAQSFAKDNAATVSIQLYDILHRQSNISRSLSALSRSDRWTNGINSYFMVHFIYRLNLFGGMNGRIRTGGNNDNNGGGRPAEGTPARIGGGNMGGGGRGGL